MSCRIGALALLLALATCTPARRQRDPFGEGSSAAREGQHSYRVRLEVVCDRCLITFMIGASGSSLRSSGTGWTRSYTRFPLMPEAIRLTASTNPAGGELRAIRISVDGEVVAYDECGGTTAGITGDICTLTAETVSPPGQTVAGRTNR